jgi:hypothetical protein
LSVLGFGVDYSPSQRDALAYTATAMAIKEKHSQLLNEAMTMFEEVTKERKQILDEFAEFLKQNSLRLQPKPVGATYPY